MGRHAAQIALLAGAAFAGVVGAQTQPEGPVIVGERRENWEMFDLRRVEGSFEFIGQHRSDRIKGDSGTTQDERETLLREMLTVSGEASIGHKNLIDLTGVLQFELDQRKIHSDTLGLDSRENNVLNLYDVRALILGNGPVPTTIYSRREQSTLDNGFTSSLDQTTEETGIIAQFVSEVAPTTLQYFHRTQDLSDPFNLNDSTTVQDTFNAQSAIRLSSNQRLDLSYNFNHIQEEQGTFFSDTFDQHDANIGHTVVFGPENLSNELFSFLHIYDQSGLFAQTEERLDERLTLRHTDRLESHYFLTIDQKSFRGEDQNLYRGEASIKHRLFDSLTSTATVGAQRLDFSDNSYSEDEFVLGQLDYTKSVPMGRIDASGGVSYDTQYNSARGGTLGVFNETHIYIAPFPIVLNRRNVIAPVIVLPPSGFPPYHEGTDYVVHLFSDHAELSIPLGSAINDGQTVLVSYSVGPEPENTVDTLGTTLSFRYTLTEGALQGLAGYIRYHTIDQSIDTLFPDAFVLNDVQDLLLGVEYARGGFDLRAEHDKHDSTIDPYDSDQFWATYSQSLGRGSSLHFDLEHSSISYKLVENHVDFDRLLGHWDQRISASLDFSAELEYRKEQNDFDGGSEGFLQNVGLTWHKAQTTIYGSIRNAFLNTTRTEQTSQFIQLGVRRAF